MYHNAGEYAVLQIWGEVYEIMKYFGLSADEMVKILKSWTTKKGGRYEGLLSSYMLEVTIEAIGAKDSSAGTTGGVDDGSLLLPKVSDKTDSKGTGLWSALESLKEAVPCPSLIAGLLA